VFKLKIVDWYVFRSFIATFLVSSVLFVAVLVLFDMMNQLKFFLNNKVSFSVLMEMYFYKTFFQFTMISPAAALFAAIYTINKMARNNELIAVINSGMSVYRLTISLIIFGLLFSTFLVYFNDLVVFPAERKANTISDRVRRRNNPDSKNTVNVRLWGENGVFWKAAFYDAYKQELSNIAVVKLRRNAGEKLPASFALNELQNRMVPVTQLEVRSNAGEAILITKKIDDINDVEYLGDVRAMLPDQYWLYRVEAERARYNKEQGGWDFSNGRIRIFDREGTRVVSFDTRFFPFGDIPYDFEREVTKVNAMTTSEARAYINKLEKVGDTRRKAMVEYHLKYSFPLVNGIIIIIGISFGGFSPKSVLVLSFFVAIVIYLLYYTFVALGLSMGKMGSLPPLIGAWMGNIVFLVVSLVLLVFRKT
jgi:lipopolysaccharide export LptBFGC system permease protein LptF